MSGKLWYALAVLLLTCAVVLSDGLDSKATVARFRVDPSTSHFIAHAHRGGLAWFKGHDHYLAVGNYAGEASLSLDTVNPASLKMTIRADSLEETGADFTSPQKAIIKKEVDEIVLEHSKYPTIEFESTAVEAKPTTKGFDVKIYGNITLHGITRKAMIPAVVTINGPTLNAKGKFDIDRSDFKVKATSAFHGMVRVKDRVTLEFDINARRT